MLWNNDAVFLGPGPDIPLLDLLFAWLESGPSVAMMILCWEFFILLPELCITSQSCVRNICQLLKNTNSFLFTIHFSGTAVPRILLQYH